MIGLLSLMLLLGPTGALVPSEDTFLSSQNLKWEVAIPSPRLQDSAVDGERLYCAWQGFVVALATDTGVVAWQLHPDKPASSVALLRTPTSLVHVTIRGDYKNGTTIVQIIDPTSGQVQFSEELPGRSTSRPFMLDNDVLLLLEFLDPRVGAKIWHLSVADRELEMRVSAELGRRLEGKAVSFGREVYKWVDNDQPGRLRIDSTDLGTPAMAWVIDANTIVATFESGIWDTNQPPIGYRGVPQYSRAIALFDVTNTVQPIRRWVNQSLPSQGSFSLESVSDIKHVGEQLWANAWPFGFLRFDRSGQVLERLPNAELVFSHADQLYAVLGSEEDDRTFYSLKSIRSTGPPTRLCVLDSRAGNIIYAPGALYIVSRNAAKEPLIFVRKFDLNQR